jgi:hypothetical protein
VFEISNEKLARHRERMLSAPRDLERWDLSAPAPDWADAGPAHAELFTRYRPDLHEMTAEAVGLWTASIDARAEMTGDREEAYREQWTAFPAGPASHPPMVALIRRYWLACDALNHQLPESQRVAPECFMLAWLNQFSPRQPRDLEALRVVACMPCWPMGLDDQGNWI